MPKVKEAGNSLRDRMFHVEQTWQKQRTDDDSYVLDVFEDSVVVKVGNWRQPDKERKCYRVPYTVNEDKTIAFADMSQWQEVMLDYVPVAAEASESVTESLRGFIEEAANGIQEAVILVEGLSKNNRFYTSEALASGVEVFEGAKMYVDHPTLSETAERPERSVRDLVGIVENVYVGKTRDGRRALKGTPRLASSASWLQTLVDEGIAGALSVHAMGKGSHKDGALVVESFVSSPATSVDFVTVAGAGGGYELSESAAPWGALTLDTLRQHRPDLAEQLTESEPTTTLVEIRESEDATMTEKEVQQLQEALAAAKADAADLRKQLRTRDAETVLNEALGEGLPEQTVKRLRRMAQPDMQRYAESDGDTTDQLRESLNELVTQERDYIASFGGGQVTLPVGEAAPVQADDAVRKAFAMILPEDKVDIAVNGRK